MDATPPSWYVYILRCADGTLYTGMARDADKRLKQHSAGKAARYTRARLPVELLYREAAGSRSMALRRELALKRWPRAKKLSLIASAVE